MLVIDPQQTTFECFSAFIDTLLPHTVAVYTLAFLFDHWFVNENSS